MKKTIAIFMAALQVCVCIGLAGCSLTNETILPSEDDFLPTITPEYNYIETEALQPIGEEGEPLDSILFIIKSKWDSPVEGLTVEISSRAKMLEGEWIFEEERTTLGTSDENGYLTWENPLSGRYRFYISNGKRTQVYEIEIFERQQMSAIHFTYNPT